MTRILYLAADTPERARIIKRLRAANLDMHPVSSTREALALLQKSPYEVAFVDTTQMRARPHTTVTCLRRAAPAMPVVLIITDEADAKTSTADGILRKPFTTRTFKARLAAVMAQRQQDILTLGDFSLDMRTRAFVSPQGTFHLTPREAALMREFLQHPGEVLSRPVLLERVWNTDFVGDTRTLDVHIHWLRKKLEPDPRAPRHLLTVRRVGYRFEPYGSSAEGAGNEE